MEIQKVVVLNGPNLNLLGEREPGLYGNEVLDSIIQSLAAQAAESGVELIGLQSNHEGELVDWIQQHGKEPGCAMIINAGAYTHTSIAVRDALLGRRVRFVEVHLSNVYAREPFRHKSYLSDIACGVIAGLGSAGYRFALEYLFENYQSAG